MQVFGLAETVVLGRAADFGLGKFERALDASQIEKYYKVRPLTAFASMTVP
jgi:hypothetical protein